MERNSSVVGLNAGDKARTYVPFVLQIRLTRHTNGNTT